VKYLSVCDGIGAAHQAWKPIGWRCVGASEIAPFPKAVVEHRHPEIPALGSMTEYHEWNIERPDLVCGGTPCQSFSVAGLRKGMEDPRGNLALVFLGVIDHFRPRWVVWENVPGVLSSNQGRDFGAFLGGLGQLGYGFAYRVLDAQYFGLAQRRKRVFVVGCLGDWRSAAAVLFERESLRWHLAPRRTEGKGAPTIPSRSTAGGGLGTDFDLDGGLIPEVAGTMKACHESGGFSNSADHAAAAYMIPVVAAPISSGHSSSGGGRYPGTNSDEAAESLIPMPMLVRMREGKEGGGKGPLISRDQSLTLATANDQVLAFAQNQRDEVRVMDIAGALAAEPGAKQQTYAHMGMQVRRLTPEECEALQGFPRGYTNVPWRGKPTSPDGPRYKALGNSWAVPVVNWIGQRIESVDALSDPIAQTP
jgi:DNA (cytosine-5)-methyltransferase 1